MKSIKSLYVHLPFCRRKCQFCDFPVIAAPVSQTYLDVLMTDMTKTAMRHPAAFPLDTIFIGGGTPTLLSETQLSALCSHLRQLWTVSPTAEISIECDPGTLTQSKATCLHDLGINRVSVGAQTLDDEVLKLAGRSHNSTDFLNTIGLLINAGFENKQLSVDLIIGLPGTTKEMWDRTLRSVTEIGPGHISTYFLTLEENTPFHSKYREYQAPLPSEATAVELYTSSHDFLSSHDFRHYEISNYAQFNQECRHSLVYWSGNKSFYGVGLGAASYIQKARFTRPRKLSAYYRWVEASDGVETQVSLLDEVKNRVMYQLRRAVGIDLLEYERDFGTIVSKAIQDVLSPLQEHGLVTNSGSTWRLTVPTGFLVSSAVLSDIFLRLERSPGPNSIS